MISYSSTSQAPSGRRALESVAQASLSAALEEESSSFGGERGRRVAFGEPRFPREGAIDEARVAASDSTRR